MENIVPDELTKGPKTLRVDEITWTAAAQAN
jgi:hypothetical protein